MELINQYFNDYQSVLTGRLEKVGLVNEESCKLLSVTSTEILRVIRISSLEAVIKILLSDNPQFLLYSMDTQVIADKTNLDFDKVTECIEAISPVMKQIFIQNNNELVAATASLAWKTAVHDFYLVNKRIA